MRPVLSAAVGAACAIAVDELATRRYAGQRIGLSAAGLVGAAAIYAVGRRGRFGDARERAILVGTVALAGTAATVPSRPARLLVAAGWLAHAGYDAAFAKDPADSRIPSWYPAMCAGYDAALAARLALR